MKIIFTFLFTFFIFSGFTQNFSTNLSRLDSLFKSIIGMEKFSIKQRFETIEEINLSDQKFCLSFFKISGIIIDNRLQIVDSVCVKEIFYCVNGQNRISLVIFKINHSENQKIIRLLQHQFGNPHKALNNFFNKAFEVETDDPISYFWRFRDYGIQLLSDFCFNSDLLLLTNNNPEEYLSGWN
jgi:hypothetical protein